MLDGWMDGWSKLGERVSGVGKKKEKKMNRLFDRIVV